MKSGRRATVLCIVAMLVPFSARAQQVSDETFRFVIARPAFAPGQGPRVCIDEGHSNYHTVSGRYTTFARLLREDGYVVDAYRDAFTRDALRSCDLLVVANALAAENENDWNYPHHSAFTGTEIEELMAWVRAGGRFLLLADHAPFAGAAEDLAAVFGVVMIDVYADAGPGPDVFRIADGTLMNHAILQGRFPAERVDSLVTFTGQAMQITQDWEPLVVFGPDALARINVNQAFRSAPREEWPDFPVAGWVHGAARTWEEGRVVFLGEAAMCSAQVYGPERIPMGMNDPRADRNPQFCLNVVRWLTG